jgi:hypothetical protein
MQSSIRGSVAPDVAGRRFVPHGVLAVVLGTALMIGAAGAWAVTLPNGDEAYNTAGFVVQHAWVKFAGVLAEPLSDDPSREDEDALIARFIELNRAIPTEERTAGDPASSGEAAEVALARSEELRAERAAIENRVERILEGRLTRVAKEAGLTRRMGGDLVWPPVSIEFEEPPSVLIESPRAEIRRSGRRLLDPGLPIDRVQSIESAAEDDGATSALVVNIGAIATYPAIVPPSSSYRGLLETIGHEWMHHYLYFAPLGRNYYDRGELVTLNETVANMAGAELGARLAALYPLRADDDAPSAAAVTEAPAPPPGIDFAVEMRTLRRDVDALLAAGNVDAAERLMEETRRFLADNGYYIRRINQAYFAFHGSYGDTPASSDPIGPALQALRDELGSLEAFVETARELTSRAELDAALAGR